MELDCAIVAALDGLADRCAAGIGYKDDKEGLKFPMPFGVYQFVYPDEKTRLAVTCLVKTCACSRRCDCDDELAVIFETQGKDADDYPKILFSSLEKGIKCHMLAPLMPTARIIQAAKNVCAMQDQDFAVRVLQRTNLYEEKKILINHALNLDELNPSQANAVEKFIHMQSGVMTIEGPPGISCFVSLRRTLTEIEVRYIYSGIYIYIYIFSLLIATNRIQF